MPPRSGAAPGSAAYLTLRPLPISDSDELLWRHRLSDQSYNPITQRVVAHQGFCAFPRIVDDLVVDHDPLTELGTKVGILNPHSHRPPRRQELLHPGFVPAGSQVPLM